MEEKVKEGDIFTYKITNDKNVSETYIDMIHEEYDEEVLFFKLWRDYNELQSRQTGMSVFATNEGDLDQTKEPLARTLNLSHNTT